jgi:CRISPR type III-A-associated RAMP protein Csm5
MISKIIELETLTPLFIKGKEEKYGEGFIRFGDIVYLIDNDKLCKYIDESNKITEYTQYFSHRESDVESFLEYNGIQLSRDMVLEYEGNEKKFKKFLNNRNQSLQRFEDYQAYKDLSISYFLNKEGIFPTELKVEKDIAIGVTKLQSENRFIQNGNGGYYIPGSSLKGAFRNALLWKILKAKSTLLQSFLMYHLPLADVFVQIEEKNFQMAKYIIKQNVVFQSLNLIRNGQININKINEITKKYTEHFSEIPDVISNTLESISFTEKTPNISILDSFQIDYKEYLQSYNERWESANNTLRDLFRLVKISDGNFVQDFKLEKKTAKAVCKDTSGIPQKNQTYKKKFDIKLECTPKAVKSHFKITIDTGLAKAFFPDGVPDYFQSVEELLKVVNEFFRAVAYFEDKEYYKGARSIPEDVNPNDKREAKFKVNTTPTWNLYKSTFGLAPNDILFRTGWGGGFISKTQFLHFDIADRVRIRNMIRYNGSDLAPKSRCLIVDGQDSTEPLGWCKLSVLGDAKDIPLPSIDTAKIRTDFLTEQSQGMRSVQQYQQGSRRNQERPVTEKEIQHSKAEANAILKQAEKQKEIASKKIYKTGEKVSTTVENSILFQSVTVKINDQTITIQTNFLKKSGDQAEIVITEMDKGKIIKARVVK